VSLDDTQAASPSQTDHAGDRPRGKIAMQSPTQPTEQSPATAGARFAHLALAAADLWYDRRTSAILVLTVASIIAPLLPLVQSAAIAALGFVLALLAYGGGALAFNAVLGANLAERGYVCRLEATYIAVAAAATLLFALLAAVAAGYRASRIEPAECLRGG
jgi:hypothetical protein